MIRPLPARTRIGARIDPRESPELVAKVRLIVETAFEGKLFPARFRTCVQKTNGTLKALHATPKFWRQTYLGREDLMESTFADGQHARGITHGVLSE